MPTFPRLADEFPDYPESDVPPLPVGFVDQSWHNDVCPSFYSAALRLLVFVDYADPAKSEYPEARASGHAPRFTLHHTDETGATLEDVPCVSSDNWRTILEEVERVAEARAYETLAAEFEQWTAPRGYATGDADELLTLELPPEHRAWLSGFVTRWDAIAGA